MRKVYCDNSISASRYGGLRPQWEHLKSDLRPGDVLVVWEASRTARDLEEFVGLRNLCADIGVALSYGGRVLDLTLGDDRFVGGLDALIAERESEQIRVRVLRGKRAGALAGRPAGRVPWGYRWVSAGVWALHPTESLRVRDAVERILGGESFKSVYQRLRDSEGYAPGCLTTMIRSLSNPALAGLREHRGQVVGKGTWPALITEEQHLRLVNHVERSRRTYQKLNRPGPEPVHLLSHIAICGRCNAGLEHRVRRRTGKAVYVCPRGHCERLADPMDREVERRLFDVLSDVNPEQFEGDDTSGLWDQIEELENQLSEWTDKAIVGEVGPSSFAKIEKGINERIENLRAQAQRNLSVSDDFSEVPEKWEHLSVRDKRRIIRAFFTITVHPGVRGIRTGLSGVEVFEKQRTNQ